jgi:hypothetical protein
MTDILGLEIPVGLPALGGFTTYLIWIVAFILLLIVGAVVIYYFNNRKLYKYSIVVFENTAGLGWRLGPKDKARMIRVAPDGTEYMFLKNRKIPLSSNGARKMGTNQYWFAKGQDGEYYNVVLGDLDAKLGILDIEPVDRDVKYAIVNSLKQAKEDYGPVKGFMEKYGVMIISVLAIGIILFGMFYIIKEFGSVAEILSEAMKQFSDTVKMCAGSETGLVKVV